MDCYSHDFYTWFGLLQENVMERTGVNFTDEDSVREDYERGEDVYDVIDSICDEYADAFFRLELRPDAAQHLAPAFQDRDAGCAGRFPHETGGGGGGFFC